MTADSSTQALIEEIREIRKLVELLAEPAIAQRDAKFRTTLKEIVGSSVKQQQAVFLMDGSRSQADIVGQTTVHQGQLSTLVGRLDGAKLLLGDRKRPKIAISIPPNFFEKL